MNKRMRIPDEFYLDEIRNDYHITSNMKKVWAVQLDLLYQVEQICKRHNISFFSDAGTTLGAVRHGGFIPWDDDLDIVMPREDYEMFCKFAIDELESPFFLQTEETDAGSLRGHAQLRDSSTTGILYAELEYKYTFNQGIFIDIFPLDSVPNDKKKRERFLHTITKLKNMAYKFSLISTRYKCFSRSVGIKKKIKDFVYFLIVKFHIPNIFYLMLEKTAKKYNSKDMNQFGKIVFYPYDEKRIWDKALFSSSIEHKFEMMTIPVPVGYDTILMRYYGDWHKIIQKKTTHGDVLFDTEKPYQEYLK